MIGVAELFNLLESNKPGDVEDIKKVIHDLFHSTKDNWLVNGLLDYYLSTNSLRAAEVLAGVREPHDKHLLDRLSDILSKSSSSTQRIQALTLLGQIARRQPTWLYKLANHILFRDLLKLLKVEVDMLSLMSALFLLVMLLPMLPAALGPYLSEILEVFGRLCSYYHQQSPDFQSSIALASTGILKAINKDQLYLLHLQVGLHCLFHRLYAMYPCNFIAFLKQQYIQKDQLATFTHTIRPMLDSVRMHPSLVTASKDAEISATRWKKMEHHDVMAECGRFTLDKCREEVFNTVNSRCTPPLDQPSTCTSILSGGITNMEISNGDEGTFWSPSMVVLPHSPPFPAPHEPRSTPSTPNNRSGTSPPEAAVEATPETTPVKDIRKLSSRQMPVGSSAVRALSGLGNGTMVSTSRPSTPTAVNTSMGVVIGSGLASSDSGGNAPHGFLMHKMSKVLAERQSALQQAQKNCSVEEDARLVESDGSQNDKNDSWQEDQEVLEIVSSHSGGRAVVQKDICQRNDSCTNEVLHGPLNDLPQKLNALRFHSPRQMSTQRSTSCSNCKIHRSKSCPDLSSDTKKFEESATQTLDSLPYECLLLGILDQKSQMNGQKSIHQNSESRLSPSSMLDKYVETCTRTAKFTTEKCRTNTVKPKQKKRSSEDDEDDAGDEESLDTESACQLLQLMQIQLQFERQRREVHAERNRRLLGKLRDSRALEEHNYAMTDRLKLLEKEIESLKSELEINKKEARHAEEQYKEALHHWQSKCVEEQRQNQLLKNRLETLELELKDEQRKVIQYEYQVRSTEAALFDAGHQLKGALKAANRGKELERTLDTLQKKFLLLGEAQSKLQEGTSGLSPVVKHEAGQLQRSYGEELTNLRRQLESRLSLVDALRVRLVELENKDGRKEAQLVELQRLLQETKEQHESELQAVESKYKAQVEINLFLEGRILELHGTLEAATSNSIATNNVASSASPKERSPPLSASLASSSEGSLAFINAGTGIIMNDCCDTANEIPNLQAIIEPITCQATSPYGPSQQRRTHKQD